jgi:signal transduction histidine kinase
MVRGVRGRITLLATIVVLAVLALTGAALAIAQRQVLTDNVDEVLQRHNALIAGELEAGALTDTISGQGDDESFARVLDADGRTIATTEQSLGEPGDSTLASPAGSEALYQNAHSSEGLEYRVLSKRHGDVIIHTGTPLDDVNDSVSTLASVLIVAVPSVAALLAALVWFLVGRVLRPVEDVRRRVAEITGSNLDRRVPEPTTRDEIARLAHTMNEMLERIEAASARQRRFVADASHELRSPLARIRAELDVDLAHPEAADVLETQRRVLEEADKLQNLVEDLLVLARSDGAALRREPVDLDDVVLDEVRRISTADRAVDVSGVSGAQVVGDPTQLARAVRNLLDNAVQYGGTNVSVQLGEQDGAAILTVSDDGPGIPPQLREQVFERFARIDESRTASRGGTGLGLAITRGLVEAHGGTIGLDPGQPRGARFVVRLPLSPPESPHSTPYGHRDIGSSRD